jgi:hypothetical protein
MLPASHRPACGAAERTVAVASVAASDASAPTAAKIKCTTSSPSSNRSRPTNREDLWDQSDSNVGRLYLDGTDRTATVPASGRPRWWSMGTGEVRFSGFVGLGALSPLAGRPDHRVLPLLVTVILGPFVARTSTSDCP